MSEYQILTVFAAFAFIYSIIASRLENTPINGALVYVLAGMLLGPQALGLIDLDLDGETLSLLAELALAVCLFTDASSANLGVLKRIESAPIRLLLIGLPLTIALGLGLGMLLFDELGFFEIALIATMLAPTDAALGKAVVTNPVVPEKVRESLNVESGLNDGICVPVILFFIALAVGSAETSDSAGLVFKLTLEVIGIGVVVGAVSALLGGLALRTCATNGWVAGTWLQMPIIALALMCFGLAQWLGGSGFIACFVAGLIFGGLTTAHKDQFLEPAEGAADALALLIWFTFGTVVIGLMFTAFSWQPLIYAILSLTVVRMLPVAISMIGMNMKLDSLLFIGWFGPRGLASIVFVVMVAAQQLPGNATILATVAWTILLSVAAHGLTANFMAARYGARVDSRSGDL